MYHVIYTLSFVLCLWFITANGDYSLEDDCSQTDGIVCVKLLDKDEQIEVTKAMACHIMQSTHSVPQKVC